MSIDNVNAVQKGIEGRAEANNNLDAGSLLAQRGEVDQGAKGASAERSEVSKGNLPPTTIDMPKTDSGLTGGGAATGDAPPPKQGG